MSVSKLQDAIFLSVSPLAAEYRSIDTIFLNIEMYLEYKDKDRRRKIVTVEGGNQKSEGGVLGIHHITAIARNPQRNIDFYSGLMGL